MAFKITKFDYTESKARLQRILIQLMIMKQLFFVLKRLHTAVLGNYVSLLCNQVSIKAEVSSDGDTTLIWFLLGVKIKCNREKKYTYNKEGMQSESDRK